jgi:hypothetical protein
MCGTPRTGMTAAMERLVQQPVYVVEAPGGNRVEAKRHLEVALNDLMMARRELEGAKHANTADIFVPREHHGLLHRREGVFGKVMEFKEHQGLKKAQRHVEVAQHEIDAAERLCPDLPLICDGQRLKSGSFVGMLMFNGFLGEVHYRQMITKNIHEVDRQIMAVRYALQWCTTVVVAEPPRPQEYHAPIAAPVEFVAVERPVVVAEAPGGNRVEAKRHLEVALNELMMARRELEGAKHANTADIFMPREHHGLLHRREGVFGKVMEFKEHQGLKKAQRHVEVAQHEIDAAERLNPVTSHFLVCDGQRLKSGSFVGMLMFNGFLGEVHYRQMITKNIQEVDRQIMAVRNAVMSC